ncbi:hypothetical protein NZK32_11065 [Cyanobium sp. FGCU-52]|nr:hypothetical protein [Cyanobium sp. FGCU52]
MEENRLDGFAEAIGFRCASSCGTTNPRTLLIDLTDRAGFLVLCGRSRCRGHRPHDTSANPVRGGAQGLLQRRLARMQLRLGRHGRFCVQRLDRQRHLPFAW